MEIAEWQNIVWLVGALCAMLFLQTLRRRGCKETLPPGPKGLPVIGNLHQVRLPLHKLYSGFARKYGPVFMLRFGSMNAVLVSSHEKAKEFFGAHDAEFASRPPFAMGKYLLYNGNDVLMAPYGSIWRDNRRLCTLHLLITKRVQSFSSVRREEVDIMMGKLWSDSKAGTVPVNLTKAITDLTTSVTWRILCGRNPSDMAATFHDILVEINSIGRLLNVGDALPWLEWLDVQGVRRRFKRVHSLYDSLIESILSERNIHHDHSPNHVPDFIDILLDQRCPPDRIKALILDMAAAGIESITTTIEWAMSLMLKHPHVLLKVKQEIYDILHQGEEVKVEEKHLTKLKYLECVVAETMRLRPPFPLYAPHYSIENASLCGYSVPKETVVFVNIRAIGRDATVSEDAEEFKPDRFMDDEVVDLQGHNLKSIPFGSGRRGCPGAGMAITMIMIALSTLVHRFDWTVNGELDMTELEGLSTPRKNPLFAIPKIPYDSRQGLQQPL